MTKLLLTLALVFFCSANIIADESAETAKNEIAERVDILLDDGVIKNSKEIRELSALLSEDERNELFDEYEQGKGKAIALNMLGFGIGSFLEQDKFGGYTQLTASIVGWSAIIGGFVLVYNATEEQLDSSSGKTYNSSYSYSTYTYTDTTYKYKNSGSNATAAGLGWACITVGVCSLVANTVFGLVRPCVYTKKYNRTLKWSLRSTAEIDSAKKESLFSRAYRFIQDKRPKSSAEPVSEPSESVTEMSFSPIINPVNQSYGLSLRFDLPSR